MIVSRVTNTDDNRPIEMVYEVEWVKDNKRVKEGKKRIKLTYQKYFLPIGRSEFNIDQKI